MQTISYEQLGAIGWLRLSRPERLNAMTTEMWGELAKLGESLGDDASLRCLVVIGDGRAFSSGIDVEHLLSGGGGGLFAEAGKGPVTQATGPSSSRGVDDKLVSRITDIQEAYTWLADAPYPTIAAMRGYALGGGLQLALACDLRIATWGTKLALPEHKYGLLPDLGGTYWLPRIVGPAKAKELIFTGETIDAEEALRIGLVNRVVTSDADLEAAATALAERIAAQPPIAVRGSKRAIDMSYRQSLGEGLREAAVGQAECIRSADFLEAVQANLEKRVPVYKNA
jgi:enoyl-CoA hydratase/carnithine racemase